MRALTLPFTPQFVVFTLSILFALTFATAIGASMFPGWDVLLLAGLAVFGALTLLGFYDLVQTRHAILRNYPVSAHLRFMLEEMRPEMRQYFFESEKTGCRSRADKRAIVYQRAKMEIDKRPFGTQIDVYEAGLRMAPSFDRGAAGLDGAVSRRESAGPDCARPYSIFGIEYFRDEFRRSQRQRHSRAQRRRQDRRLRP